MANISSPFNQNSQTAIIGVSDVDGGTKNISAVHATGALYVHLDSSDVSIAGGTEYTEGDIDATITGTAMLWEDGSDTLRAVSAAKPLPVNIVAGSSSGTEYTEDAVAPADPAGGTVMMTRDDQLGTVTEVEGDWSRLRGTSKGALWVALADSAGDPITSFGGGTQYTEDAAAAANPTGTALNLIRADALAGVTTTDGDNLAARGTDKGELYVKHVDAIPVTHAALTELAAAINASSQMDVNIAASGATLTVASHAVTNAGTFVVQENGAALTSLQLADDVVATLGTSTYTETTTKGTVIGAVRRDADTTLVDTTNEIGPLQMDANGRLKVEAFSGETLPVSLASVPSHAVTNAGTFAVQMDGSALTALQLIDDPVITDDAAFTPATTKVMMAGFEADETSTDSVDEGDGGAARMTLDRKVITTIQPHTAGGLSVFNGTSSDGGTALTSTAQAIKASAGQVYGWYIYNPNATAQFVQLYNTAQGSVTVGTTNPLFMLTIPATSAANVEFTNGITFSNAGFSCAATATAGGNGAPTTALDAVIFYK